MAANEYQISAGLVPIDNSSGATANAYYISAGLVPTDTAAGPTLIEARPYDTNAAQWADSVSGWRVIRAYTEDTNAANLVDLAVALLQHNAKTEDTNETNFADLVRAFQSFPLAVSDANVSSDTAAACQALFVQITDELSLSDTAAQKLKIRHWLDKPDAFQHLLVSASDAIVTWEDDSEKELTTPYLKVPAYDTNAGNLADHAAGHRRIYASATDDNSANLQDEPEPYLGGKEIYAPAYSDNSANLIDGVSKRSRRWQDSVAISLEIDWTPEIYPIRLPIGDQVTIQDGPMDLDAEYLVGVEDTLEQSDLPKIHLPSAIVPLPAPAEDALEQSDDVQVGYIGKLFVRAYDNNDTLDDEVDRSLIGFLSVPASDENTSSDAAVGFYCMFASVSEDAPDWQAQPRIDFTGPGYLGIPASSGWPYYGTDRINLFLRIYASVGDSNQPDDYVKGFGVGLDLGGGDGSIPTLYSVQPAVPLTAGRPV